MKTLIIASAALASLLIALPGQAAIDGSKPFICSARVAHDCDAQGCDSVPPEEVGMASFARVDLKKKRIEAIGTDRVTPIEYMETPEDGGWIIGGVDGIRGWSATIADESGQMAAAISGAGFALVIHGVCAQI